MTPHEPFEEMLARRFELSPAEESRLQGHLRDCPQCRATADVYAQQQELLRTLPAVAPPPALRARVLGDVTRPPSRLLAWRRPALLLTPLGAGLAAIALAFALLHHPHATRVSVPATRQQPTAAPAPRRATPLPRAHHARLRHQSRRHPSAPVSTPPPSSAGSQIALQAPVPTSTPGLKAAPPVATATVAVRRPRPAARPPSTGSSNGGPPAAPPPAATPMSHPTIVVVAPRVTPTPVPTPTHSVPAAPVSKTPVPTPTPSPNP